MIFLLFIYISSMYFLTYILFNYLFSLLSSTVSFLPACYFFHDDLFAVFPPETDPIVSVLQTLLCIFHSSESLRFSTPNHVRFYDRTDLHPFVRHELERTLPISPKRLKAFSVRISFKNHLLSPIENSRLIKCLIIGSLKMLIEYSLHCILKFSY